jgi:hypothetical protein
MCGPYLEYRCDVIKWYSPDVSTHSLVSHYRYTVSMVIKRRGAVSAERTDVEYDRGRDQEQPSY